MPVTIKVNGVANSLVHKGSNGISIATIPDVCKTPSPGGPIPIPYPNISQSTTLDKGTTTVKADGGMMIAIKGSEFSLSNGDNAGVAGGVKSSTFMKESTWILYSFDVKMDGSNACRLTDKKFQNHENTVDLGGTLQVPTVVLAGMSKGDLEDLAEKCNTETNKLNGKCPGGPKGKDCTALGTAKHKCCENAINEYNKKNPNSKPALAAEQGFDKAKNACTADAAAVARKNASKAYDQQRDALVAGYAKNQMPQGLAVATAQRVLRVAGAWYQAYRANGGPAFIADVLVYDPPPPPNKGSIKRAYDFKFNCKDEGIMSDQQFQNYKDYTGKTPRVIHKDGRKC
jgi:hypothetical protein